MVDKRPFTREPDDDLDAQSQRSRQRLNVQNPFRDVMRWFSSSELDSALEPFVRRVVREEVEKGMSRHFSQRCHNNQNDRFRGGGLKLQFIGTIKEPVYTGSKIEAQDGAPLRVVLVDSNSGQLVTSSSMKVEIVALKGDLKFDYNEIWSEKEFVESLARQREGRKPLLAGNLTIKLENGVGIIQNIFFTDNSSWTWSRKFRIAAKVVRGERIREAISEACVVLDQRGESYQKHYPPGSSDDIWRLEEISKSGMRCKRLANQRIFMVKDFLQLLAKNPSLLRRIIGKLSDREWGKIIDHAKTCVVDDPRLYEYEYPAAAARLFLDCIYNVKGATFDGKTYLSPEKFDSVQKEIVEQLKQLAYGNSCRLLNAEESVAITTLLLNQQPKPLVDPIVYMQPIEIPSIQRDGQATQGFNSPTTSTTSYAFQEAGTSTAHSANPSQDFLFTRINSFGISDGFGPYIGDNSCFQSSSQGPILSSDHLSAGNSSYSQVPALYPWDHATSNILFSGNAAEVGLCPTFPRINEHIPTDDRPSIGWFKIWAAVKWGISFRKEIARKNRAPRISPGGLRAQVVKCI